MSILTRTLLVLITLRLLLPPGICVCKLSAPAARLLVAALGGDPADIPAEPDDHHHHAGCPASHLAAGLGVQPAGPGDIDLSWTGVTIVCEAPSCACMPGSPLDLDPNPPSAPRHLVLCVLLV